MHLVVYWLLLLLCVFSFSKNALGFCFLLFSLENLNLGFPTMQPFFDLSSRVVWVL